MKKLNVFLLCNDDISTNLIFSGLFDHEFIEVKGIAFTETLVGNKGGFRGILSLLKKCDLRYFIFLLFINLFFKFFEKLSLLIKQRPIKRSFFDSIRMRALKKSVPVYSSGNFNGEEFINIIKDKEIDLILIRVNQILKKEILLIPRLGTFCVHSSLLPAYKGIAGEFHAMRKNEKEIGSSIFYVTEGLDQGPVIFQNSFKVDNRRSLFFHILKNNHKASIALSSLLQSIHEKRKIEIQAVDTSKITASYFSWPSKKQVNSFLKNSNLISFKDLLD